MFFSLDQKIKELHESRWKGVLAITGGGSGALTRLLSVPGASGTILEGIIPYSNASILDFLKRKPDHFSSEPTARLLAIAAFQRAQSLAPEIDSDDLFGIGATASLASDRPKKGDHRIHIGIQSLQETWSFSLTLTKGERTRAEEEELSSILIIFSIFYFLKEQEKKKNCGRSDLNCFKDQIRSEVSPWKKLLFDSLFPSEIISVRCGAAGSDWGDLLFHPSGPVQAIRRQGNHFTSYKDHPCDQGENIFPGSFHPIHWGHLKMRETAEKETGIPVVLELSVQNVDKPSLDYLEIADRLAEIEIANPDSDIVFTQAPRFIDKADLFPESLFIVGADTLLRIADLSYYNNDQKQYEEIVHHFSAMGTRFLVFARPNGDHAETLSNLPIDENLRHLCREIPVSEFLETISSTEIRKNQEKFREK
ncbi:MAG: hypothetical protein Q4G69_08295 [Planctomycetia bacterium]|nr:hypothetical protein [Planctomycetia bacterium]